jgi:hypothetical protein
MVPRVAAFSLAMWFVCSFAFAAPVVTVRTNPQKIIGGGVSVIAIRVTDAGQPLANQAVKIAVVDGQECGTPQSTTATTGEDGTIPRVQFTGGLYVEACVARIEVTTETPSATAGVPPQIARAEATVTVNPNSGAMTRVDGFSAIALVLVVSFAIDRLVRGLLFLLSYSSAWARRFPDPAFNNGAISVEAERNRRLIYFVLAGSLGMIALGWFGQVRILSALGFTNVNRWLDILVTGLILAGGAERTEQVLKSVGASGPSTEATSREPIEIRGKLTIEGETKKAIVESEREPLPLIMAGSSGPPVGV